ncbi:MAG: GtrA family protein [Sphingobacterium sp.]|jgi:putative flippase GtrA|nr:GtrA family protein [Sphingobacterium sp.]
MLKILKFGIVGIIGLIIDFTITFILKEKFKINKFIANSAGFLLAVVNNYLLNKYWTFHSVKNHYMLEFLSFFSICFIGLVLNNTILYILNEKNKFSFYLSKAASISIVMIWNFSANYLITFH